MVANSNGTQQICVIGAGLMGSGIGAVCLFHGHRVCIVDTNEGALEDAKRRVGFELSKMEEMAAKKKKEEEDKQGRQMAFPPSVRHHDNLLASLEFTMNLAHAVQKANLVIEAIVENLQAKWELLRQVAQHCRPGTLLATNTSSIRVADIARHLPAPVRAHFCGLHFFNPVPKMPLVEVIPLAKQTQPNAVEKFVEFVKSIGKVPLICKDSPGFIANRILIPMLAEAIGLVEREVATPDEVDQACQLGLGLPIGPFRLLDFVGLDTAQNIIEGWAEMYPEEFPNIRRSKMLARLVAEGKRGRKTGHGFYAYPSKL